MKTVCIITCYKDPDYVRARTLRQALRDNSEVRPIVVKNKHRNLLRYPEVALRLLAVRLRHNPDIYLLTFRGYEMLPVLNLVGIGKKCVFDEFINLIEWGAYEHRKFGADSMVGKIVWRFYRLMLQRTSLILADTEAHAAYSARLMRLPLSRYRAIPVGADESVFTPAEYTPGKNFTVFYYGNMLPLHGLRYVVDAAVKLADRPDISFLLVGGGPDAAALVEAGRNRGAAITYEKWVPFEELAKLAAGAGLCVGGPFGNTLQSRMVVTGKTYQFLAMGLPTLVGEVDAETPFVDHKNCLLVPQGDSDALAAAVEWAADHRGELAAIGREGRKTYERHFSAKVIERLVADALGSL